MWNGAAEALKPSPVSTIASPTTSSRSSSRVAPTRPIPARSRWPVAPNTSANPNRSTAEPKLPTIRYLSPDSSDVSRSMSIAQSMYRLIENHSSPRKRVTRLDAETMNIIPAAAVASSAKYSPTCSCFGLSEYAIPTVSSAPPAMIICASAASRSRRAASATIPRASGLFQ